MEKETYDCEEYQSCKENEPFPAERYHVNETQPANTEHFDVPETAKPSADPKKSESSKMSIDEAKDLMNGTSSTASASASSSAAAASAASGTASVGASIGVTGVVSGVAAIFVAVTTGVVPVEGMTDETVSSSEIVYVSSSESSSEESSSDSSFEESSSESSSEESSSSESIPDPIDVGTLAFRYYKVDYYPTEDGSGILSDIVFHFDGAIADGISATLSDAVTGTSVGIEKGQAFFTNVERGEREFTLSFQKDGAEVETRSILVEDQYLYDPSLGARFAYRSTFNADGTSNLYAYLTPGIEGEFETSIRLFDETFASLDSYPCLTEGPLARVMNVQESSYVAALDSYFVKDGNYYSFYSQEGIPVETDAFTFNANVQDKTLTLSMFQETVGDVSVTVTHDDGSSETLSFPSSDLIGGTKTLELSALSQHPTIEVIADVIFHNGDPEGKITTYDGTLSKHSTKSLTVDASITSFVALDRCEIFNTTYNASYENQVNAPVYLYLNGFLNPGDTYSIEVIDVDGTVVASSDLLSGFENPVRFMNLYAEATYTFRVLLNDVEVNQFTKELIVPAYENLPDYYCSNTNPGDAYVTYNEDGTSNVYLQMSVQATTYDMYYKVTLYDCSVSDDSIFYEFIGNDSIASFENIPRGIYSIKYASMLRDGDTAYSVFDRGWPSGTLELGLDDAGRYPNSSPASAYFDSGSGVLYLDVKGTRVVGDVTLTITPESGEPLEVIVPEASFSTGGFASCEVDLSSYGLETFGLVIDGEAVFQYGQGDEIKAATTVRGKESCPFHYETSV